jgi:hypothetical protein
VSFSLEQLRGLPTEELVRRHDRLATNTSVGVSYYLEELARRDAAAQTQTIIELTEQMAASSRTVEALTRVIVKLTVVVAVLTAASLVAVVLAA